MNMPKFEEWVTVGSYVVITKKERGPLDSPACRPQMIRIEDHNGVPFKEYYYDKFPHDSPIEPDRELVKAMALAETLNAYLAQCAERPDGP